MSEEEILAIELWRAIAGHLDERAPLEDTPLVHLWMILTDIIRHYGLPKQRALSVVDWSWSEIKQDVPDNEIMEG